MRALAIALAFSLGLVAVWGFQGRGPTDYETIQAATTLKDHLINTLNKLLKEKGPDIAFHYCNTKALLMTEKASDLVDWQISRVTDKPRNPNNQANEEELALLAAMRNDIANGELKPVYRIGDVAYQPQFVESLCLTCHGKNPDPQVADMLAEKYPDDKATGYVEGELRGMLKVAPRSD